MNQLHFDIDIAAPREKVWNVLWDDATYRDWTAVFAEGSYAVSDWREGSTIQFIDPASRSGMSAVIEKKRPAEFMSFRHEAEIRNGQVQPTPEWAGAHESYTLKSKEGGTRLSVDLDTLGEQQEMFERKFPQALRRVKTLAESS